MTNARTPRSQESELQPLISRTEPLIHEYGTESSNPTPQRSFVSRFNPMRRKTVAPNFMLPVDTISEDAALHRLTTIRRKPPTTHDEGPDPLEDNESAYLRSKLWHVRYSPFVNQGPNRCIHRWSGFLLMNLGETGNFISYAFAPASMVAPLGTVSPDLLSMKAPVATSNNFFQFALMANCFFAPLLLGEQFKKVAPPFASFNLPFT